MMTTTTDMTLRHYFETIYVPRRLRGKSDNTVRLYQVDMGHFKRFLKREPMVSDLNTDTICGFLDYLQRTPDRSGKRRSPYTIEKARTQFMALARYAFKKHLIPDEPEVMPTTLPARVPRGLFDHQVDQLVSACASTPGTICDVPADKWWLTLVLVIFETAERVGAIRHAQWSWLDLNTGWLSIPAEHRKGKTRDRIYPLRPSTLEILREIHSDRRYIWPWPWSSAHIYYKYAEITKRAGLYAPRQAFHAIRRTAASYFEAAGGNATELLDHSKRSITTKSYLDPRIVRPKFGIDLLFEPKPVRSEEFAPQPKVPKPRKPKQTTIRHNDKEPKPLPSVTLPEDLAEAVKGGTVNTEQFTAIYNALRKTYTATQIREAFGASDARLSALRTGVKNIGPTTMDRLRVVLGMEGGASC